MQNIPQMPPPWQDIEAEPLYAEANAQTKANYLTKWKLDSQRYLSQTDPEGYKQIYPALDTFYKERSRDILGETALGSAAYQDSMLVDIANTAIGRGGSSLYRGVAGAAGAIAGMAKDFNESDIKKAVVSIFPEETRNQLMDTRGIERLANYAEEARATGKQIQETFPVDEDFAGSIGGQILSGFADVPGQLAPYIIPGIGPLTAFGAIYEEQYQDRLAAGGTPEEAHESGLKTMPAGALDYLSDKFVIGKILKPLVGKASLKDLRNTLLASGILGGAVEGLQTGWQNFEAKYLSKWDENRPMTQGLWESVVVGAIVDASISTGGQAVASALTKETKPVEATPNDFLPPELQTPTEQPTVEQIADEAGVDVSKMTDEQLLAYRDDFATSKPEVARLYEEEIRRREEQPLVSIQETVTQDEQVIPEEPAQPEVQPTQEEVGQGSMATDVGISTPEAATKDVSTGVEQDGEKGSKFIVVPRKDGTTRNKYVQTRGGHRVGDKFDYGFSLKVVTFEPDNGDSSPRGDETDIEYIKEILGEDSVVVGKRRATDQEIEARRKRLLQDQQDFGPDAIDADEAKALGLTKEGNTYVYRTTSEAATTSGQPEPVTPFETTEPASETTTEAPRPEETIQEAGAMGEGAATIDVAAQQNELAQGLEPLREQLVRRAEAKGVEDAQVVASDAIQKAIRPKKDGSLPTLEEAGKIANSTALEQAIADSLRKQNAQKRTTGTGEKAVSLETPIGESGTLGETVSDTVEAPDQQVMAKERATAGDFINSQKEPFAATLNPKEKAIWDKINAEVKPGEKAPKISDKDIEKLGAKFRSHLVKQGMRGLESSAPRITAEDTRYLELAKDPEGNKTELQRMVDQAAKDAGYDSGIQWHGTDAGNFSAFEVGRVGYRGMMLSVDEVKSTGIFFSESREDALGYGKNARPFVLRTGSVWRSPDQFFSSSRMTDTQSAELNKAIDDAEFILSPSFYESGGVTFIGMDNGISRVEVDPDGDWIKRVFVDGMIEWSQLDNPEVVSRMKQRGYESVMAYEPNDQSGKSWFVTSPTQIKSADPITRDAEGNIIPLSQRFNTGSNDIRYSKGKAPEGWTPTPKATQDALKATHDLTSVNSMLKSIASKSKNPAYRALARVLARKNTKGIRLRLDSNGKWRNSDGQYGWDKGKPTLVLNLDNIRDIETLERVALHEAIHAFTLDLIDLYEADPRLLTSKQRATIESMQKILDKARSHIIGDKAKVNEFIRMSIKDPVTASQQTTIPYGLTSLAEFVTESMSNPEFQALLKQIPFEGQNGTKSLWSAFVEAIKNLFNAPKGSALDAAISNVTELIDMQKGPSRADDGAMAPPGPVYSPASIKAANKPTRSLQKYIEGLSPKVRDHLKGIKYETSPNKQSYDDALIILGEWKERGLNAQQMVDRALETSRLSAQGLLIGRSIGVNETVAIALMDLTNAELNGMSKAAYDSGDIARGEYVDDEQTRLNASAMGIGSTAGKVLQMFSVLARSNTPGAFLRQANDLFFQVQKKKLPTRVKKDAKTTTDELNGINAEVAASEEVSERATKAGENLARNKGASLAQAAKGLLKKLEKERLKTLDKSADKSDIMWAVRNGSISTSMLTADQKAKLTEEEYYALQQEEAARPQDQYPVKDAYEDMVSKSVASDIVGKFVESKAKQKPPLEEFYNRMKGLISKNLPKIKTPDTQTLSIEERITAEIEFMVRNRGVLAEQMTEVRDQLHRERTQLGLSDDALAALDKYIQEIKNPSPENINFGAYIRKELGSIRELVTSHYAAPDLAISTLTDKLLAKMPWLSFSDASSIAISIEREFQSQVQEVKRKALEAAFERQAVPQGKRKTLADKIIRQSNIGALDEAKYYSAISETFGIPTLTRELAKKIKAQANALQDMRPGRAKEKATQDLYNLIIDNGGASLAELWGGFWKGGIFSTFGGQMTNLIAGLQRYQIETALLAGRAFTQTGNPKAFYDIWFKSLVGYVRALPSVYNVMVNGDYSGQGNFEAAQSQIKWEAIKRNPEKHSIPTNFLANIVYVSRIMAGMDILNSGFGREARLNLAAWNWKNGQPSLSRGAFEKGQNELDLIGRSTVQHQFAQQQATQDGFKRSGTLAEKAAYWRRVEDILDEQTDESARQEAATYQRETSLQGEVYGMLGFLCNILLYGRKLPRFGHAIDYVFPVIRSMGNFTNDFLNYTPQGVVRLGLSQMPDVAEKLAKMSPNAATLAMEKMFPKDTAKVNATMMLPESATGNDIALFRMKVALGNLIFTGLLMGLVWRPWDEDDEEKRKWNYFDVIGPRPRDGKQASIAEAAGVKWLSVKVGDTYLPYEASPLYLTLATIGTARNNQVFRMWKNEEVSKYALAMTISVTQSMANVRVLDSGVTLLNAVTGKAPSEESAVRTIVRQISGILVPIPGFVREAEGAITQQRADLDTVTEYFGGNLPIMRSILARQQPKLDYFGRPADSGNPYTRRFFGKGDTTPEGRALMHVLAEGVKLPGSEPGIIEAWNPATQKTERVKISPADERFYDQTFGEEMRKYLLNDLAKGKPWTQLEGEELQDQLEKYGKTAGKNAKKALRARLQARQ